MSASRLLSADERTLVAATTSKRLAKLDVDQLVELHERIRRARNKYLKLYRRQASRQVGKERARGVAATKNQKTAAKAEVFEEALSAVSAQLAVASKQNAARLRDERLGAEAEAAAIAKARAKKKARVAAKKKAASKRAAARKSGQKKSGQKRAPAKK